MDERDRRAAAVAVLRVLGTLWAFWALVLVPQMLFGGIDRGDAFFMACTALGIAVLGHLARRAIGRGRVAGSGPFAGLGPADIGEVVGAVREGRAVPDPRLAASAVRHAEGRMRVDGTLRYVLAGVVILRVVTLVLDRPASVGTTVAYGAVVTVPVVILALLSVRNYQRAGRSEELNRRLEGGVR